MARLFRAAARAEVVHRGALRTALRAMKVEAVDSAPVEPKVSTTREHLAAVVLSETQEAEHGYPEILSLLQSSRGSAASRRIIEYAMAAEAQHARLFKEALENLGHNREVTYYVCPTCSTITETPADKKCSHCKRAVKSILIE